MVTVNHPLFLLYLSDGDYHLYGYVNTKLPIPATIYSLCRFYLLKRITKPENLGPTHFNRSQLERGKLG